MKVHYFMIFQNNPLKYLSETTVQVITIHG